MLSYCLKCRKNMENINPRVLKTINGKTMIYQNVLYAIVKKANLLKRKKQAQY